MDQNLQDIADKIIKYLDQKKVQYCDVRADQQIKKSALIENDEIEHITDNENKVIYNTIYHYLTRGSVIQLYYVPVETITRELNILGTLINITISLLGNYEEMAIGKYMTMRGCVPQLNDIINDIA